jgi:hypothetical protein
MSNCNIQTLAWHYDYGFTGIDKGTTWLVRFYLNVRSIDCNLKLYISIY